MADALKQPEPTLYDLDFFGWTQDQGAKLRARSAASLDWNTLAEEITGLGDSHRDEIESRLAVLLVHLLKWQFQPDHRSNSWKASLFEQRMRIGRRIKRSPSLRAYPGEVLPEEYEIARRNAAAETGLAFDALPSDCPYTIEEVLDHSFLPGEAS